MDEHRLSLRPVVRRVWARCGQRPVVRVQPRYAWLTLAGFVHPAAGTTHWLILPTLSAATFMLALAHFAQEVGAGAAKRVLLVLDQAGAHLSTTLVVPDGIELVFLPAYAPELQPAEHLWPLVDEGVVNRHLADLDALDAAVGERCITLAEQPALIRSTTLFHWWPKAA